jgi:hypothetical protein
MAEEDQQSSIRPPLFTPHNAPMRMQASLDRLEQPYSRVTLRNTGPQVHVIIDRHQQGVELRPGEVKHDVEMLNEEIAHLQRQRDPGRLYNPDGRGMRPKPLHPVVIEGVGDMVAATDAIERAKWQMSKRMEAAEQRKFLKEQLALLDSQDSTEVDYDEPPSSSIKPKPKYGRRL